MQVAGQNQPQYNCYVCNPEAVQYQQPQYTAVPQNQYTQPQYTQPQTYQIPATTSGVNIQIINPTVTTPGANAPTYNVNSPCYPSNYYTNQYGQNQNGGGVNSYPPYNNDGGNNQNVVNNQNGNNGQNNYDLNNPNQNGVNGQNGAPYNNGSGVNGQNINNGQNGQNGVNNNGQNSSASGTVSGGVNNGNGGSSSSTSTSTSVSESSKNTQRKNVVQLTDQYIMNLENYLNSQDTSIRLHAANEVYNRLEEDPSRKDDKALTALINKMLQDPSEAVRVIAFSALEGRLVNGDDFTVKLLQDIQNKTSGNGQDAIDASKALLQMSEKTVEKEVPTDTTRKTKVKTIKKEETKTKKE